MEFVYLAFILFILGVGSTIVYDKYKDRILAKVKEVATPSPKPVSGSRPAQSKNLDDLLQNVRDRARRGQTTFNVQQGTKVEAMSVKQLIEQLERLKKNL